MKRIHLVSFFLHLLVGWRLVPPLTAWPVAAGLLAATLAASAWLMPRALDFRGAKSAAMSWVSLTAMGLFSSLFVFTLLRELVLLADALAGPWPGMRAMSAAAVAAGAVFATVIGMWNARRTAAVKRVDIPVEGLPPALEGFTIAQLSDIHVGPTIKGPYLEGIVDAVNRLDADMVAVTGDLVDGSVADLKSHVAPLSRLASRHGTYFVTGNHEYYSGAAGWIRELRRLGLTVLLNEHVVLSHDGAKLVLAGVTDVTAHHFDAAHRSSPQAAMAGAPRGAGARVLLAHQPLSATEAEKAGFDVQLSGHTHGGQFWPWGYFVRLQQPFTAGLHRLKKLRVYVSRGTGYWGPPKRFGAPSEIAALRLVRAAPVPTAS